MSVIDRREIFRTKLGRRNRIRTCDPCLPKAVLYQTELLSELYSVRREIMMGFKGFGNAPERTALKLFLR